MLRIAYHPLYTHPLPEGHRFPMLKYELIPEQLLHEGLITPENLFLPEIVSEDIILQTHDASYWKQLKELTLSPKDQRRIGFPLTDRLVERECRIAQGTIDACHFALKHGIALNVAGGTHHAGTNRGEGFCLLNDQAIAANYLINNKIASSVLIIDLDVHQGNGTAQIFEQDPRVFTFSMHGANNFPYRKEQSDLDIALPDGMNGTEYLAILKETLPELIARQQPGFVFYLSGVDVLASDKLGKLSLTISECKERDRIVLQECINRQLPVQVSMGGGYSPQVKDIVEAHCNTFRLADKLYF
jgi:acetoin utilization deacetylase AcuC-like enzyme